MHIVEYAVEYGREYTMAVYWLGMEREESFPQTPSDIRIMEMSGMYLTYSYVQIEQHHKEECPCQPMMTC